MGNYRVVTQKGFFLGLNAATGEFTQPPKTIPRISNMLYTTRGALKVVDGTFVIEMLSGGPQGAEGQITAMAVFQASGTGNPFYVFMQNDPNTPLANVAAPTLAGTTGGTLAPGTYSYEVTALDGVGGETNPTGGQASITIASPNNAVIVTWAAVTNAAGYRVYGRTSAFGLLQDNITSPLSFTDTGSVTPGASPPLANNTQQIVLVKLPAAQSINTYAKPTDVIASFSAGAISPGGVPPALSSPVPKVTTPSGGQRTAGDDADAAGARRGQKAVF